MARQIEQYGRWVPERKVLAQMASSDGRVRIWLGILRRRPLVLSSPYPASECLQRLTEVTTSRGPTSWYLDPRTVRRPEPRFRGEISPSRIMLFRFTAVAGRNSFFPVLDVRPGQGADGGTTLSGEIGMGPAGGFLPVLTGAACLGSLSMLVAGVVQLILGHLIGLAPALAFPLPVAAMAGFNVVGHRSLERDIPELLQEVNEVLGSTAAFPGASAIPAAGSNDA